MNEGVLTREDFLRAREAIFNQRPEPARILVSMGTIESARWAAHCLEAAAGYAEDELLQTPRWRWLRRRVLRRQIAERSRNADSLRWTFGWPR